MTNTDLDDRILQNTGQTEPEPYDIFARRDIFSDSVMPLNKKALFSALKDAGITQVDIEFDGEGDSGQVDDIQAWAGHSKADLHNIPVTILSPQSNDVPASHHTIVLQDALEALVYELLECHQDGWQNNEGSFGNFKIDVVRESIGLNFHLRISDVESSCGEW